MFDVYDRLRSYLMGLERVQTQAIGSDEGFFYQADNGIHSLFCTISPVRYRFLAQALVLPKTFHLEPVRGWPGWMQALNPCCQDEEALWLCLSKAYQQVVTATPKQVPSQKTQTPAWMRGNRGGNHVAKSA